MSPTPVIKPDALIVVAPEIAPAKVIPPDEAFNDLTTVSPSASTVNPGIVIVPIVKSPVPSIDVAPVIVPPAFNPTPVIKPDEVIDHEQIV